MNDPKATLDLTALGPDAIESMVRQAIDDSRLDALTDLLNNQFPADLADVLERLADPDDDYRVFSVLRPDTAAEVLDELGRFTTAEILRRMPIERVVSLLNRLPMDDLVEILADDIPERADEVLGQLHPATADEIRALMRYPDDSAGRLMTRKYVRINADMTAEEVLAHIRRVDARVETVTNAYVLDPGSRLIGVISLRETLMQPPRAQVRDYMETQVISVEPDEDQEAAARLIARYDFLALPVVTQDQRMLGIITVDDAIDVLAEENSEDLMRFGGVTGEAHDQPYFTVPVFRVVRSRLTWLLLLFLADFITSGVLRSAEDQLQAMVMLSFYIPLLIGTGGNTGAQTVSMVIRGMAVNDIRFSDFFRVARREVVAGLLLGTLLGVVALGRSLLLDGSLDFALVIGLSILAIVTWSNTIASVIPLLAKRVGIDPAVISAPLISTTVDATGLMIYLGIATLLLGV